MHENLAEEQFRTLMLRVGEEFLRTPLFDDLAGIHENHPIGNRSRKNPSRG